jgi:hypothetical protein
MPKMRQGCVQVEGAVEARSLGRSEVEMVVFELSVRKTLEGRQCGCRDLALALPINTRTVLAWHPRPLRNSGPQRLHVVR